MDGLRISDLPRVTTVAYDALVEISQSGLSYSATPEQIAGGARSGGTVAHLQDFGVPLDTPDNVALALNTAATQMGMRGPSTIILPTGTFPVAPNPASRISFDEGATLIMTEAMSSILWQGSNTIFQPISNRIEMFAINGALNTRFRGIQYDNSPNGCLHGLPHLTHGAPGTGTAGQGNSANCFVRQYRGANVEVDDCDIIETYTCFQYTGSEDDDQVLVGRAIFTRNRGNGCVMGFLPSQPEHLVCNGNEWLNGVDGQASDDPVPGHLMYISNTHGASPYTVMANNNYAKTSMSSILKMRKGIRQVATGNVFDKVGRGIESANAISGVITGNTISIVAWSPTHDDNQSCIEATGWANGGEIGNNALDRCGAHGFTIRVRPADINENVVDEAGQLPRNIRIHHNTITDDGSGPGIRPPITLRQATDCEVSDNIYRHIHEIVGGVPTVNVIDEYLVECDNSHRIRFKNNQRRTAAVGNPTGSHKLYFLGGPDPGYPGTPGSLPGAADCTIEMSREDLDVPIIAGTVSDGGTGNRVLRNDAEEIGTWAPLPTFSNAGTFAPFNMTQNGWYRKHGNIVTVGCRLKWDSNAGNTSTGTFRISGFPFTISTFASAFNNAVGFHRFAVLGTNADVGVIASNAGNLFTLRRNDVGTAGTALDHTTFPPGGVNFEIGFEITVRVIDT